jgi:hypothetical protein
MKIYITDIESYNQGVGVVVGGWIELPMEENLLAESIENVLQEGKRVCKSEHYHEEIFISDWESEYIKIEEYSNISELNDIAEKMETLNPLDMKKFKALIEEGYDFEYSFNCKFHNILPPVSQKPSTKKVSETSS